MTNQCTQMRLLITGYLHDELGSAEKEKTKAHLDECADCKAYFIKIKKLEKLLKSAIPTVEIPSVKNEVMKKISETEKNMAIRKNAMTIRFNCTDCKRHFEAEPKHIGKKMKCPKCGTVNVVPSHSTIAPKQVRPPSNIANADTGVMPAISPNVALANSATPLVGELPTVKEMRKISSEVRQISPGQKARKRRLPSEADRFVETRRSRDTKLSERKSNSQKYLIMGISAVGFVLILVLSILLFSGDSDTTPPIAKTTENGDKTADSGGIKPNLNPHKGTVIVGDPEIRPNEANNNNEKEAETTPGKIVEPLQIVSTRFPRSEFHIGEENLAYGVEVKGGVEPHRFIILNGRLPQGLVFENGVIKGTIQEFGEFKFTVQVTDAQNTMQTMEYSLVVYDKLSVDSAAPPQMVLNEDYKYKLVIYGGKKPYSAVIVDAMLPRGIEFDHDNFLIRGRPLEAGSLFYIELSITDSIGQETEWNNTWEIVQPEESEPEIKKPQDDKDDKEPEKPEDEVEKPDVTKEKPELSQTEIRLLLMQYWRQAQQLTKAKKYEEAIAIYAKILELDDMNATAYYNTACAYSILKNKDKAIEFLEAAIRAGFRDLNHIVNDPDLDNLKHDRRFKKLTKNQDVINKLSMDAIKAKVDKEFPTEEGFLKGIDHENKLIFATNLGENRDQSREILRMLTERIESYAKSQWRQLFEEKPKYYITIALPKKQWFDKYKISKGFPPMVGGWYNPADKFLIAGTMGHTLTHEFTHAMHYADMEGRKGEKNMHIWFTEGIATCFEDCKLPERSTQKPEPIFNNRVKTMVNVLTQPAWKKFYWNWRKFFSQRRSEFMHRRRADFSYAQSRGITLWLYRLNKLKRFYENYMDSCDNGTPDGANGITAMEMTFKMKLEDIEKEWIEWMKVQNFEPPKAFIGITISNQPSNMGMGVVVSEVREGGGAEDAGMQVGDIIVTFNRMAIDNSSHLMVAIAECKIGHRVDCVVIRNGKPIEFKIKLKKRPKEYK